MNNKTFIKSIIFSFVLSGVLFFSVLLPCIPVCAASPGALPYPTDRFNEYVNPDSYTVADLQEFYDNRWGSTYPIDFSTTNTLIISRNESFGAWGEFNVTSVYVPNYNGSYVFTLPSNTLYESFDYTSQSITLTLTHYSVVTFTTYRNQYSDPTLNSLDWSGSISMFGSNVYPSTVNGSYEYLPNKIVFTQGIYTTGDFESGHAVEPSFDSDTIIDSGLHPNVLPSSPTYTTYNITTYQAPSIDTSSVENLLKSIWDVISYTGLYIVSNVGGFINNFWNNISLALGYICDLLSYLFNKLINTIKQVTNNLYLNFKDLFEPVLNSFENFINIINTLYNLGLEDDTFNFGTLFVNLFIPDQSDLESILVTNREYTFISNSTDFVFNVIDFLNDVMEEDSIYEIHLPSFVFAGTTIPAMTISFDWYIPIKPTIDAIISAFLIFGYGWWLFTRIAGFLHGQVPDAVGSSTVTVTDRSKEFSGFPY